MPGIFKARVVSHRMMSDHIQFKLTIDKGGELVDVFSKSYVKASTPDKTDIVLGMTRKRLALMGLDMDTCTDDEWDAFMKIETLLAGKEVDVEEKDNGQYGTQYDILTNTVADESQAKSIRDALRGIKGRPRAAAPAAPARPTGSPIPPPMRAPAPLQSGTAAPLPARTQNII